MKRYAAGSLVVGSVVGLAVIVGSGFFAIAAAQQKTPAVKSAPAAAPAQQPMTELTVFNQERDPDEIITGVIREIATDQSHIIIESKKVLTTPEFIEESYVEAGDKVKIAVIRTPQGLQAINCSYIFDEGPVELGSDEPPFNVAFIREKELSASEEPSSEPRR